MKSKQKDRILSLLLSIKIVFNHLITDIEEIKDIILSEKPEPVR